MRIGDRVRKGELLYTLHAQSRGELDYAAAYAASEENVIHVDES